MFYGCSAWRNKSLSCTIGYRIVSTLIQALLAKGEHGLLRTKQTLDRRISKLQRKEHKTYSSLVNASKNARFQPCSNHQCSRIHCPSLSSHAPRYERVPVDDWVPRIPWPSLGNSSTTRSLCIGLCQQPSTFPQLACAMKRRIWRLLRSEAEGPALTTGSCKQRTDGSSGGKEGCSGNEEDAKILWTTTRVSHQTESRYKALTVPI